jgi:predicted DNA-binding protein with PD1-like motif
MAWARPAGAWRVTLAEGEDLSEGLVAALTAKGVGQAAVQWLGGGFRRMEYLTGQPDASGERVAAYSPPTALDGPVSLLGGNGILGRGSDGATLLHCHAVVVDRDGRIHGGHLPPGVCIAGAEGLTALVTALDGAGFQAAYDAETNYPIFQPAAVAP